MLDIPGRRGFLRVGAASLIGLTMADWFRLKGQAAAAPKAKSVIQFPVVIGASRKRFLGRLLAASDGAQRPFAGCDDATVAVSALAAAAGAWCVRVHAVPGSADAVRVAERWRQAAAGTGERR